MNNNYFNNQNLMNGAGYPSTAYDPTSYMTQNNANLPFEEEQSTLTVEQEKLLEKTVPANSIFDISISKEEDVAARCNHIRPSTKKSLIYPINEHELTCSLCKYVWSQEPKTKEEVESIVNNMIDVLQQLKMFGLPATLINNVAQIIPILKRIPDIYEYGINNMFNTDNKLEQMYGDPRYAGYPSGLDAVVGAAPMTQAYPMNYGMMQNQGMMNQGMVNQGMMQNQAMMNTNQLTPATTPDGRQMVDAYGTALFINANGGYVYANGTPVNPQNIATQQVAPAATVNPMQATVGIDASAPNKQFVNQAENMLGGATASKTTPTVYEPAEPEAKTTKSTKRTKK